MARDAEAGPGCCASNFGGEDTRGSAPSIGLGLFCRFCQEADELNDGVAAQREMEIQNEGIGQIGLVVIPVSLHADQKVAMVLDHLNDLHGNLIADNLPVRPLLDGGNAPEVSPLIMDECILGEGGHEGVAVEVIGGGLDECVDGYW